MVDHTIVKDIRAHADKAGYDYSVLYCGIASDVDKRLFEDHNVPREGHWRIKRNARSEQNARDTEEFLLDLGFDGGTGGGDSSTIHVYAYRKSSVTEE